VRTDARQPILTLHQLAKNDVAATKRACVLHRGLLRSLMKVDYRLALFVREEYTLLCESV
jgi:hypothetical protein